MINLDTFVDHELKMVKITVKGEMFQADGERVVTHARTMGAEHGYDVLYDIRQATTTVPLSQWYSMPRDLDVFKKTRAVKAAVLASPDDKAFKDYEFYETVASNLGFSLRIFFDEEDAIKWLSNTQPN